MTSNTTLPTVGNFSDHLSVDRILSGNVNDLTSFFYLIIMIAIYAIVIYHFYRYIARRDCFKPSKRKHTKTIGFLKYFFLYPFVASIFFLGFSLIFIALTKTPVITPGLIEKGITESDLMKEHIQGILSLAFAIVIAIRITAYYTEDLSKDLAKMLPFAILGVFLVDSTYFDMGEVQNRISFLPEMANYIIQLVILIIIVEWGLRILLAARYKIFPKKEKPEDKPAE